MISLRFALPALLILPTPPRQQDATPTIHVNTKLTIVDVTVTDKAGRPVHGLTQSDFIIKEDGKPQSIRNFDEYGATIPFAQPVPAPLPPGIYTNQPTPAPTTSASNILLLDSINTGLNLIGHPELFLYAQNQAASYLKNLPPGTRVAIMVAGVRIRLVKDFYTVYEVLRAAISHLTYEQPAGTVISYASVLLASIDLPPQVCTVANRRSHLTMDALRQLSAFTSGIQGRKNVVWFTPGIPWLTNYQRFQRMRCLDNLTPQLNQTYSTLTAARAALYTADSNGLQVAADMAGMDAQWHSLGGPGIPPLSEFDVRTLDRESLQQFAEATGGKAFFDRNDLDAATAEAIATGSDYYTISYIPPRSQYDDQFHAINVTLKSDPAHVGLRLQYKNGYTALDLAKLNNSIDRDKLSKSDSNLSPAVNQFRAQMAHGATSSTQLLLATRITPVSNPSRPAPQPIKGDLNPKIKTDSLIRYDVIYSLPAGQVTLKQNPDGTHSASVEFDVVAYAEDGTKLNVIRQTANVTLKPQNVADFQQKPFEVPLQLDLLPGKLFLCVGALDLPSGKYGTLEVPQTVAKPAKP